MNIGVIFAGGVGKRMNSRVKPKQFIDVYGKPIIIHTLELFENHPQIDAIAVACLEEWIPYLKELLEKFEIKDEFSMKDNHIHLIGKKYDMVVNENFKNKTGKNIIDSFGYYENI